MPVRRVLKRLGGADHLSLFEEPPGEVNRLRLAVDEADGKAHLRMAGKVGDRQQLTGRWRDEDVESGHQIFHFQHELGAGAHGADVFDGRNQAGGAKGIWPVIVLLAGEGFHAAIAGQVVERGGRPNARSAISSAMA